MTLLQKGYRTLFKIEKVLYNRNMFKKNTKHLQPALIPKGHDVSAASELLKKQLKLLKGSWANSLYHEFPSRMDEEIFTELYSNEASQLNIPVNVLVGLEVLKAGFG